MVARGSVPQTLPPTPHPAVRNMGFGPVRFTFSEALSMVEQGILPEDSTIELLDGVLVYRDRFDLRGSEIVEGTKHNYVVSMLGELDEGIKSERRHLRTQSTFICSESHAPIPDGMVLRRSRSDYRDRLPQAADALCVIEVADSSYERDAGEKLNAYAKAGIEQYIIVNLRGRTAEVYTRPDSAAGAYLDTKIIPENQQVALRVGDDEYFSFLLSRILP
jgi:Uma2 family endonuclease